MGNAFSSVERLLVSYDTGKTKPTSLSRVIVSTGARWLLVFQLPPFLWAKSRFGTFLLTPQTFLGREELNKKFPGFLGLLTPC